MVRLKNIKRYDNMIESDIIPEDSTEYGHIIVNLETDELEMCYLPKRYEWCRSHVIHSKNKLIEISKTVDVPEEKLIMWY